MIKENSLGIFVFLFEITYFPAHPLDIKVFLNYLFVALLFILDFVFCTLIVLFLLRLQFARFESILYCFSEVMSLMIAFLCPVVMGILVHWSLCFSKINFYRTRSNVVHFIILSWLYIQFSYLYLSHRVFSIFMNK